MAITINAQPVELEDGKHFVSVTMDGHELNRHGPFPDADTAEIMAARLTQIGRVLMTERR